jgi:potassium channel subfamily K
VPTVTVFISVVGSALVSGLKVSSVWIAQRTILPERPAPRSRSTTDVEGDTKHSKTSVDETQNDNKLGDKPVPDSKEEVALELKLVREISRLLEHLGKNGGTKHDWKEWDGWLGLLSLRSVEQESESDTDMVGDGGNLTRRGDGSSGLEGNDKKTDADMGWLHEDGPLFSDLSETEWVLARLCERLEKRLKEIDKNKKDR